MSWVAGATAFPPVASGNGRFGYAQPLMVARVIRLHFGQHRGTLFASIHATEHRT